VEAGIIRVRELEDGGDTVEAQGGSRVVERELRERRTYLERPALPARGN
jgi:hypothetical protein